jgi:hypothetical protein
MGCLFQEAFLTSKQNPYSLGCQIPDIVHLSSREVSSASTSQCFPIDAVWDSRILIHCCAHNIESSYNKSCAAQRTRLLRLWEQRGTQASCSVAFHHDLLLIKIQRLQVIQNYFIPAFIEPCLVRWEVELRGETHASGWFPRGF